MLFQLVHGFANVNNNDFSIGYVLGYLLIVWLGPKEQFMHHFGFPIFFGLVLPKSCDFSGTWYLCYLIVFFFFRRNFNFASFFFGFSGVNWHPKLTFDFSFKFNFGHIPLRAKWKILKYSSTTSFSCLKTRLKQDYGD